MKNIEFREEHKCRLLEMCEVLFPEDEFTFDNDLGNDGFIDRNFLGENKSNLMWDDDGSHFHWFEFCWKILNKLMSNYKIISPIYVKETILNFGIVCFNNSEFQHPVDYLYEIFEDNEKN